MEPFSVTFFIYSRCLKNTNFVDQVSTKKSEFKSNHMMNMNEKIQFAKL